MTDTSEWAGVVGDVWAREWLAAALERQRTGDVIDFPAPAWIWSARA